MTNGWKEVPLGTLLTRIKNEVLIQDFERYQRLTIHGNNKGISIRDEFEGHQIGTKKQFVVHKGQFLLSKIDAMNGAFGIVPEYVERGIITGNFWAYDVDERNLLPKYFNYLTHTRTFQQFCIQSSSGTTHRKYLQEDLFLGKEIPLPPLEEQHRIVERVEAIAARIAKAQSLREEADLETEILAFATARKIFSNLDTKIIELGELVDQTRNGIQTGPFGAQLGSGDFIESGHPVITIGNVQFTGLETRNKLKFISEAKAKQLARFAAQEGDILFARMGTVGRCCVVPKEAEGWIYNYHLIRVALDKTKAEPRYIHWLIRASEDIETKLGDKIRGATREGVNSKIVASLPCRVPPLDEQRRIVAYLDSVQERLASLRELQSQTGEELDAFLPSVLDRAFKGEL